MVRIMGVSGWYLYIGIFLCCLGVTLPVGIIMVVYYFYKHFMDNGIKVRHVNDELPDEEDRAAQTESPYNFKGNMGDLHNKEQYI